MISREKERQREGRRAKKIIMDTKTRGVASIKGQQKEKTEQMIVRVYAIYLRLSKIFFIVQIEP